MRTSITLVLLCTFLSTSVAQVFVNVNATGNNNGSSWEDAFTNLQDAFDESPNGAAIWIAAGTYTPLPGPTPDSTRFIAGGAFDIYGGFNGTETMLDERDWETNVTILSGDINGDDNQGDYFTNRTDNARNVLITISAPSDAIIDGISIIGGNGRLDDIPQDAIDFFPWFGGGLLMIGDTEVRNCSFSENVGSIGGALFVGFGSTEDFLIDNCFFWKQLQQFRRYKGSEYRINYYSKTLHLMAIQHLLLARQYALEMLMRLLKIVPFRIMLLNNRLEGDYSFFRMLLVVFLLL